jgi:NADH-quinone oxidoreductase subunit C
MSDESAVEPVAEVAPEEPLEVRWVRELLGEDLSKSEDRGGELYLCVERQRLPEVALLLRDDPELAYTFFSECLGVDYSRWSHQRDFPNRFEVVYNLFSLKRNARLFLKVGVDDGEKVPSLRHIFLGAEFPEREVWDLFGIVFEGNEQTQRFLLPDDWVGHPLRKEFPLGGDDVLFDQGQSGPAVQKLMKPHAGESFEGKTGTEEVSGR